MYWAIAVGSAGLTLSFFSGVWILRQRSKPPKISKVIPEEVVQGTPAIEDASGKLALADVDADKANLSALRDAIDAPTLQLDDSRMQALQDHRAEPAQENTALALRDYLNSQNTAAPRNPTSPTSATSPTSPTSATSPIQISRSPNVRSPNQVSMQASRPTRSHVKQLPKPIRETTDVEWRNW